MWIILLGLGAVAGIVTLVGWAQGRRRQSDKGSVSQQWIAEQRLSSQTQESHR